MTTVLHLMLPVPPSSNRWWRRVQVRRRRGRSIHVETVMLLSKAAREYKENVRSELSVHRLTRIPKPSPVAISIAWYRARKSGDLDKRISILLDALEGVVYDNDSQVVRISAYRDEDPANPRVEVTIEHEAA